MTSSLATGGGLCLAGLLVAGPAARADHTPTPSSVTVVGSLQQELGCPGDWMPDCVATGLLDRGGGAWSGTFAIPAGSWEYKVALDGGWNENYGANGTENGPNIGLFVASSGDVRFYYSHETHWITDDRNSEIAVAAGSFQSEIGCSGDWQPDCLRTWLQDRDGDGIYTLLTTALPAGSYEAKVTLDESWNENYGAGGVPNGANISFAVPANGAEMAFSWNSATKVLDIVVSSVFADGFESGTVSAWSSSGTPLP